MTGQARSIIAVLLALAAAPAAAQTEADTVGSLPGIQIGTAVDKAEAYIGDLITYTVTIAYDSTYELIPVPLGANLGAFDVKDYEPDVESKLPDGRLQSLTTFVLSTFTTGDYLIPPLPVMFVLPDSSRKILLAEGVPIRILSLLDAAGGDTLDIKPLKAPYEFPRDYTAYYFWGGVGLAVVTLAVLFWWWRRRRRKAAAVDLRPAWEIAFEKLAFLKSEYLNEPLETQERCKAYYVALTEIVRDYLGRIYQANVLEMTSEQFVSHFADIPLPENLYPDLIQFFGRADQVKFAKSLAAQKQAEDDFLFAHDVVEAVRADYERRQQVEVSISGTPDSSAPVSAGGTT